MLFVKSWCLALVTLSSLMAGDAPYEVYDPAVKVGRLDNGMTYYIRANSRPEKRLELRLMVNAGSILEDDDQLGFAHFLEHMAFNGTEHFEKAALVDYLESIGVRFGAHLNAFTSFDMTAYMLQVPTDNQEQLEKGLLILSDWASRVSLHTDEIDLERGVVMEEWRRGQGANERILKKQFPIMLQGSHYAKRNPIGTPEILQKGSPDALRRFYKDWYRPELMAVVAVGDFEIESMEKQIRELFSKIPKSENPRERLEYDIPFHEETLFSIATDPELTHGAISVMYKHEPQKREKIENMRRELKESMFFGMFNQRLQERARQAPPPFLYGYASELNFVRSIGGFTLNVFSAPDQIETALAAVLEEARRVQLHGFTATEVERQKQDQLRSLDKAYEERDKTESGSYAVAYMFHYLEGGPIVGIEKRRELVNSWINDIAVEEINGLVEYWMRDENRVITVSLPEKEGVEVPTEQTLASVFERISKAEVVAFEDDVSSEPLMAKPPVAGTIVAEHTYEEVGVTHWKLSNGIDVYVKPTDFKNDEVIFTSFRNGGHSLVSDDAFGSAVYADGLIEESGIANFSIIQLEKMMAGQVVSVSPYINEITEGVNGNASPKDMETAMQLIHLSFTSPRRDEAAFSSLQAKIASSVENRLARPETRYRDQLTKLLTQDHPRKRPPTKEAIDKIDLDTALNFYKSRFENADGFTFSFVGNLELESFKSLVTTYLASLPGKPAEWKFNDIGVYPPKGKITEVVKAGKEPKSQVAMISSASKEWSASASDELKVAIDVLNLMLREKLREEMSGVYSVYAYSQIDRDPHGKYTFGIMFSCDPDRAEELIAAANAQVDDLRINGPSQKNLDKIKEIMRRSRETDLKENRFWLNGITRCVRYGTPINELVVSEAWIDGVNAEMVKRVSETYLSRENQLTVIMQPEESDSKGEN